MLKYKVICPIINFQIPNVLIGNTKLSEEELMNFFKEREKDLVEGIDLFDGVIMRRISKEDLEDLKNTPISLPPYTQVSPNMFILEKSMSVEGEHKFQLDKIMRNIVLALRVLKGGYVSGPYVFYIVVSENGGLNSWSWDEAQPLGPWEFKYVLNFDEIPALKKILEKIQSIDFAKRKNLHLVFRRFQRAYEERDVENQLIDFMIAFEALFLRGEKVMRPTGHTVAIACSTLLGKNEEEREEIRSFLTKAYSIRNCIVHGAEYKRPYIKKEYGMFEFVSKIEDYLRESIKKLLD